MFCDLSRAIFCMYTYPATVQLRKIYAKNIMFNFLPPISSFLLLWREEVGIPDPQQY